MIRIIIADDHRLVRDGLKALLKQNTDVEVVGEAADGEHAVALAEQLCPDVLLMDISMPGQGGIKTIEQVRARCPSTRVLILSMCSDGNVVRGALDQGANGFLLKDWKRDELILGIQAVLRGEVYLGSSIAKLLAHDI